MLGRMLTPVLLLFLQAPAGTKPPDQSRIEPQPQSGYSVKVSVDSVFLNVSVLDRYTNRSVAGLKKEDFLVYEDGVLQQIDQFQPSEAPFNLLLLLDVSGSTGFYLNLMKQATVDFIGKIKVNDRVAIAAFSSRVDLVENFTNDRSKAGRAIQRLWAGGGTSFYDALMTCVNEYMRGVEGKSAIVVFTDGIDNQLEGGFPAGSETTFDELYRRVQEAEPIIYTIFLDTVGQTVGVPHGSAPYPTRKRIPTLEPSPPDPEPADPQLASYEIGMKQLQMLAEQTGGRMYSPHRIEELSGTYSEIASDLRIQYLLGYNPTNVTREGGWREIRVKIKGHPEAVARTRKGYYARERKSAANLSNHPNGLNP
ncbi:MAG TPA: VWA domain-containing protein [Acidobacteriota bacterium]|nr:VWA domain-containing protein [Acidobacteriota bacterium]